MELNEAFTSFSEWHQPWRFEEVVSGLIDKEDINTFKAIMSEASLPENWRDSDLILGCKATHSRLKKYFPFLSDEAIGAVVRATSYQWR